jgi:organic hydroperoxide reductase OsmC/OhrA
MMGTLAAVLAKKNIRTSGDLYHAEAEGDIENVGDIIKITRIRATYYLKVPGAKAEEAREAFSSYLNLCPGAQSVINCIEIRDSLVLEETD